MRKGQGERRSGKGCKGCKVKMKRGKWKQERGVRETTKGEIEKGKEENRNRKRLRAKG